jgi:hypothetical protein
MIKRYWKYIIHSNPFRRKSRSGGIEPLSAEDYYNQLGYPLGQHAPPESSVSDLPSRRERAERAFEMVVDTRKFEIEMYWKRATYFWAFIASAFVGYVTLLEKGLDYPAFIIICAGFILSCAWHFTNLGSKAWQRHWEKHLDLLEDPFVGPLYKTIYPTETFSVSKINAIVSFVFIFVWLLLGWNFLDTKNYLEYLDGSNNIAWHIIIPIFGTALTFISMYCGYGRGRFGAQNAAMHRRKFYYSDDQVVANMPNPNLDRAM